ncbi:hypothetical protein OEZ71_11995 [Defluviimonas sp. WL0050]|uniref:Uncharacterized protein n=1 Tax=Albidovulum litorale TaxID=2984134 RepID=A0ABT2ZPE0_9RHOB|nr:hypothetical protein [Defluviimonas sp. WL0050]MCV2873015.1 hypothetical protein [Defluviimonas sp. WL0050]
MTKLSKTEAALIANAATRDEGALLLAPEGIAGKVHDRALEALVTKGLAKQAIPDGDETADAATYFLTGAGRAAFRPSCPRRAVARHTGCRAEAMAAKPAQHRPPDLDLAVLAGAKAADLRQLWQARRGEPPPTLSGRLMRLVLAWEI